MKAKEEGRRLARVEKEVQHVIAQYLISGFKEPLPGLVTVTSIKMTADLRAARVFISVLGEPQDLEKVIGLLQARAFEIQRIVGDELKMRYCPKLTFEADRTTEHVLKVERILAELAQQKPGNPPKEE